MREKFYGEEIVTSKGKYGKSYIPIPILLDTETAHNETDTWITLIMLRFDNEYYEFRKPSSLVKFYNKLSEKYHLRDNDLRIVTYVHNLEYDMSYLKEFFKAGATPWETSHTVKNSKGEMSKWTIGPFEFRCSYCLTNLSLAEWAEVMCTEHRKLIGQFDYDKIHYQDDKFSNKELEYAKADVLVLDEALAKQMTLYEDNISSMPNTKFGYIRREIQKSCLANKYYKKTYIDNSKLNYHQFRMALLAFAGGYTHANRFKRGKITLGNIKHRDFVSHYLSILKDGVFPIGKPRAIYNVCEAGGRIMTIEDVVALWPQYTAFVDICIKHVDIKDGVSMPFLQEDKMFMSAESMMDNKAMAENWIVDNGRVVTYYGHSAPEHRDGKRFMYIDNLTLQILQEQYTFYDYCIREVIVMKNGKLPKEILDVVDKHFAEKEKCKEKYDYYKRALGEFHPYTIHAHFDLMRVKDELCAIWGCIVTNPFKACTDDEADEDNQTRMDNHYKKWNTVLAYQWGVMVTSQARFLLYQAIKCIGYDNILYCDTDSVFYISTPEIEENLDDFNACLRKNGSSIWVDGKEVIYSYLKPEPDLYAIKPMYNKCYATLDRRGDLKVKMAGVPERTLVGDKYITREQEIFGNTKNLIEALDKVVPEFEFTINTGNVLNFVGDGKIKTICVDGHEIETAGGLVIQKCGSRKIGQGR